MTHTTITNTNHASPTAAVEAAAAAAAAPAANRSKRPSANSPAPATLFTSTLSSLRLRISHPRQTLPSRRRQALIWCGRLGWMGKGVLYGMIGGMACQSAVRPFDEGERPQHTTSSPEVLVGGSCVCIFVCVGGEG